MPLLTLPSVVCTPAVAVRITLRRLSYLRAAWCLRVCCCCARRGFMCSCTVPALFHSRCCCSARRVCAPVTVVLPPRYVLLLVVCVVLTLSLAPTPYSPVLRVFTPATAERVVFASRR
jgi:hypothetical protein